ncbi:MAG: DUF4382 domain-containing protein [Clostridia bacterium]|nr:DUF4382 domain-containing protein [Clostridia bacterium]
MNRARLLISVLIISLLTILVVGCAPPAGSGTLNVYVTDAPPREEVASIVIMLSEVQVHKAVAEQEQGQQQAEGEWITIGVSENAAEFDLLDIEGIEQFLGSSEIEAGKYTQVRLVVDTIKVAFKDASGNEGELEEAEVPSKELKLVHPFDIVEGETTALVIDFDADKMVTVTGADKVIVKPVVKLTVYQEKSSGQKNGAKQEVALEDTAWILQSYGEPGNLKDVLIDTEITAEFVSSEGTVRGSAGCNSYSGSYEVEDSNLSIPGPIAVTEMYCMEPEGVMDQEQEYLAALQLAESYEIDDDELQMNCGSQVLVFSLE